MLHHNNAQCHTALSITELLTSKGIPVVPQSPYSPNFSPCDLFLFPKLKNILKGRQFETSENIQKSVTDMLKTVLVEDFTATKIGNNVSIGVQLPKGSILKGITLMFEKN